MGKIISFSGAQSSGKTTLLNICQRECGEVFSPFNGFEFVPEVTRLIKHKYNLPINEDGTDITQLCIINQHIDNYLTYQDKNVIMDRCILDGLVYTEYLLEMNKVDSRVYAYAQYIYDMLISKIDVIFYTDPAIPLIDDGERSIDVDFRNSIIDKFNFYTKHLNNVIKLSGSVEDRLDKIKRTLILNNE
jgi:predicted ATPase